jgi:enamine deaminase RidA (YjgF/YER057c/UK114 family)
MVIFDNPATVPAPFGQYSHVATLADVVNVRTYVTDMSQFPEYGKVRAALFRETPPTLRRRLRIAGRGTGRPGARLGRDAGTGCPG